MVYYNDEARKDLRNIIIGLATWKKHPLEYEHAVQYVKDIRKDADTICKKSFHRKSIFFTHKRYGEKVHTYRRSHQTQWHILYDWNSVHRTAYVNKILNNYLIKN